MSTTNSIGITKWANGLEITEICRAGEGDNRVVAWRRADGAVALETNGDPVFGVDAEDWIMSQLIPAARAELDAAGWTGHRNTVQGWWNDVRSDERRDAASNAAHQAVKACVDAGLWDELI